MKKKSLKRAPELKAGTTRSELITIESFAATIQWHPESLRRACRQGRVDAIKLGRGWRISPAVAEQIKTQGIPGPA